MFEAGAIAFRLQTVGQEVFKRELTEAERAVEKLGTSSAAAAPKVGKLGDESDKTGKQAKDAAAGTKDLGEKAQTAGQKVDAAATKAKRLADETRRLAAEAWAARTQVGTAFLGIGAAVAVAVAMSVASFSDFDQGMSNVRATTQATAVEQKNLAAASLDAGASTVFSARESADAQNELAKSGLGVSTILSGGLKGSLALAAAGELEVARAAEIAATTLQVFGLKGSEASHVADLLAAAAGKAQGSVDDAALALDYIGVQSAQAKIPLEETVGVIALLAKNGVLGEKAGTGLRSVLSSLQSPSSLASKTMKEYGINVFDAAGKSVGFSGIAEQLKTRFEGLTDAERANALGKIFGNEALTVANILYKEGAEGVNKMTAEVDDLGFAARLAADKQDNLAGDTEKLGGALDSALVKTGSTANLALREMVQLVTGLIDFYGDLDPAVQGTALALGVGTAAVLLLTGTIFLAIPKIAAFKEALVTLKTTLGDVALKGGVAIVAITAIIAVLSLVASANANAAAKTQAYGDTIDKVTGKITQSTRDMAKENLALKGTFLGLETGADSAFDAAKKIGLSLDTVTDAATGNSDALKVVQKKLLEIQGMTLSQKEDAYGLGNGVLAEASANRVAEAVRGESSSIEEAIRIAQQKEEADAGTVDSNEEVTTSYGSTEEAVNAVTTSLQDLAKQLDKQNGVNLDARDAARQLEEAYDSFDAALIENGQTLDTTTEAGRNNEAALDAIAKAALDSGTAIIDAGGGYQEYKASLESSRQALLDRIAELGITGDAAQTLADKILAIPSETEWKVRADTAQADADLAAFVARWGDTVTLTGTGSPKLGSGIRQADGGKVNFYANGGRENHVAQFARAGAMRVWAEPETGGEWYIPASPAKRPRSTRVLAEAADEFGYQLVPKGAQSFAGGGRSTPTDAQIMGGRKAPMRIEGTLDLGGGLTGFIRGVINDELNGAI